MKRITISKRGSVSSLALIALIAAGLTGCSTNGEPAALDLVQNDGSITQIKCDSSSTPKDYANVVARLNNGSAGEKQHLKDKYGVDGNAEALKVGVDLMAQWTKWGDRCKPAPSPSTTTTRAPSPTTTAATTCATWAIRRSDYGPNNRWFADGIVEIKNAKTPKQARDAINVWVNRVKTDPGLFADSALYFLDKKVDQTGLFKDNCATNSAVTLLNELTLELALSEMTPDLAPANGTNTGASADGVHQSSEAGVTGDRQAVKIKRKNGKIVWIMWRCGNVVTIERFDLPTGKTDNPVKPRPTKAPTPTSTPKPPKPTSTPKPPKPTCVEIPNNGIVDCGGAKVEPREPQRQGNIRTPVQGSGPGVPEPTAKPQAVPSPRPTSTYTPPPAPKPTTTSRPTPPAPVETSAPPTSKGEPSPTVDPCTVNPNFC